jgi:CheY-like chemotaxis protein
MSARILIVDDNALYREAFRRNLLLRDYDVVEAESGEQAIAVFQEHRPDVIVTDLSMGSPTEGLEVIRTIKQMEPTIPIVMISAVGTFEEGAEAMRLGAHRVISKARIDEEIENLYATIDDARASGERNRAAREEIEMLERGGADAADALKRLRVIAVDETLHPAVRAEAFDAVTAMAQDDVRRQIEEQLAEVGKRELEEAEARLRSELPAWDSFEPATRKELSSAEYFFHRQGGDRPSAGADFSRNVGFSLCFAVENEVKSRLRKRLNKFLNNRDSIALVRSLVDSRTGQLDLFYHQHLARIQTLQPFDFTIDNVRQVFQRIIEHESRYKPDGLKALGIMVLCFGRDYEVKTLKKPLRIANPLGLRGLESNEEVLNFAHLLVALQHYRNPYIHPEISDMEKVSKIRATALECLRETARLV